MRHIHFKALQFDAVVPDRFQFEDLGYTPNVVNTAKQLCAAYGFPFDESKYQTYGSILRGMCVHNDTRVFLNNYKHKIIFYQDNRPNESVDWFVRGHEEAHAALGLGLRRQLENIIDLPKLRKLNCNDDLEEEIFCDVAGMYAVYLRGLSDADPIVMSHKPVRLLEIMDENGLPQYRVN